MLLTGDLVRDALPLTGTPALRRGDERRVLTQVDERGQALETEALHQRTVGVAPDEPTIDRIAEDAARDRRRRGHAHDRAEVAVAERRKDALDHRHEVSTFGPVRQDDDRELEHRRPIVDRARDPRVARHGQLGIGILSHATGDASAHAGRLLFFAGMGETVSFASNGDTAEGYLALPASGSGPGVLVLQEWWGVVPQIRRVADALANEGFVALVPDLYRGEIARHTEMDKAAQLMSTLPPDRAARDMAGAVDFLRNHAAVEGDKVGAIGFCMGGMLTLLVAAQQGDKIGAAAPFYGAPLGDNAPDWSNLTAPVRGHFAENDDFFPPDAVKSLEAELRGMGKDVELEVHAGTGHAFCNEDNPLGTHDPASADKAMNSAIAFLRERLAS